MKIAVPAYIALLFLTTACSQHKLESNNSSNVELPTKVQQECLPGEELVYRDDVLSTFTEDKIRGEGIVSFQMKINDRFTIYNQDDAVFGEMVLNEDGTYFTLNMPQKTIARRVTPQDDFASFDFDAETTIADKDYLIIYVNKEQRRVKKAELNYSLITWPDYLKNNNITLKACNLLRDKAHEPIAASIDQVFEVTAVKGDLINIKSSKECLPDGVAYKAIQGWVKWKSGDTLMIKFTACD
ncbi:hypothetical protein FA048_03880 [Pedobacter polaris]|uniref:Uncharacterized protein n=1 Tax=Pedobacter polaris TaxID=2571273 RepID=A0A4U1CZ45_9SPHI|nr:hypothetical protein [Pedobacter polaris]TKC12768.1 hypothetical protein FA048_03880 [Pedobacter polaris]